jgi:tRNA (cmo5U34)-methyltransferase
VPILTPDQDREILRKAGFTDITEFYTAFTFRGWVAYA